MPQSLESEGIASAYHLELASTLIYNKGWSPQEMEFTFEGPSVNDLYLLQTRDMAMRERKDVLSAFFWLLTMIEKEKPLPGIFRNF